MKNESSNKKVKWDFVSMEQTVTCITNFISDNDSDLSDIFLHEFIRWWEVVKVHAGNNEQISIGGF